MFPSNERETIRLFRLLKLTLGWRITHLQTAFPDAVIEKNGQQLVAEFEYKAKNFKAHKHDPAGCDIIVCWENNWPDAPLPVWELKDSFDEERIFTQRKNRNMHLMNKPNLHVNDLVLAGFDGSEILSASDGVRPQTPEECRATLAKLMMPRNVAEHNSAEKEGMINDTCIPLPGRIINITSASTENADIDFVNSAFASLRNNGFPMWTLPPIVMLFVAWCILAEYGFGAVVFFILVSYITFIASWHLWRTQK